MRLFIRLSLLYGVCSPVHAEVKKLANQLSAMENYLDRAVKDEHLSGVVMVAYNDIVLLNHGYGMATDHSKNQGDTVVHVASVTKQFTAAAIMLLKEKGQIDLRVGINTYLPEKYRCEQWAQVTVHHLLSHTSGIPDYAVERDYYDVRKGFCFGDTVNGMIHEAQGKPLEFEPGSKFEYSNIGYTLLGEIIEEWAKIPYREFIKNNILKPAKMYSSDVHDESYVEGENHAEGYRWDEKQQKLAHDDEISLPVTAPDGGLLTTTTDLLTWSKVIIGKIEGVLARESIQEMIMPKQNTASSEGQYGYGLFVDDFFNTPRIHHPGYIVGFRSHFCLFPAKGISIFVLCNNTTTDPMVISEKLSEIMLER